MKTLRPTPARLQRRWIKYDVGLGDGGSIVPAAVLAFDALDVRIPLLLAVGESNAQACDTDGVGGLDDP